MGTVPEASSRTPAGRSLPHAEERINGWLDGWERSGRLVLLLDFDGTLSPIVARPEIASIVPAAGAAILDLLVNGADVAVISGRGLADVRERIGIPRITYAGNHGMEIDGPGIERVHPEAAAARPVLERIAGELQAQLDGIDGALVEDKTLTLSVHYRLVDPTEVERVRALVKRAAAGEPAVRITEGKKVLEVRPRVDWDKGRAVLFLLDNLRPDTGVPVLYVGDDVTDEDAFRALDGRGEGVIVSETPPSETAAVCYVRSPSEVARLLETLAERSAAR